MDFTPVDARIVLHRSINVEFPDGPPDTTSPACAFVCSEGMRAAAEAVPDRVADSGREDDPQGRREGLTQGRHVT